MMTDSTILDAFFEECEDLIVALTEGLDEMCNGQADTETVNAVFRAVHSIKGAAGAFALDDLVGFAHKFETVLDELRAQRLDVDEPLLRVLQRAGDVLSDLVDAARENLPANRDQVDPVIADLQSFLGAEPVVEEEFVFEALSLTLDPPETTSRFLVTFRPNDAFYATGNDPTLILGALGKIGECRTTVQVDALPKDFSDFSWSDGYLVWQVTIDGISNDLAIREVFEFVEDLCDLQIAAVPVNSGGRNAAAEEMHLVTAGTLDVQGDTAVDFPVSSVAAAETAALSKSEKPAKRASSTLRVDPERVDRLINAVGELIINQSVISQRIAEAALPNSAELFGDLDDYKLLAREIQEGVMAIRAQPVKPLFQRMLRIAREAADATGKTVDLITEGEATEVDKIVVERLADPLTHMIRNAIDHGIEKPEVRTAAGKATTGTLRLKASQRSGSIVIEIIDDGAGLNRPRIRDIAIQREVIRPEDQLSDPEIDSLLFAPGFSTADQITNLSGRGVGMDVVKTAITGLGGRITISSVPGEGTTFAITLPLTLAVMDGMIISVAGQTMVVPIASILETIRPIEADLSKMGLNNTLLRVRGEYVPVIDLADRLGNKSCKDLLTDRVLLLLQTEKVTQCALAVDEIHDQRQVVVKSMQGNYGEIFGISGATILGDGKIALIIDPDAISSAKPKTQITQINHIGEEAHVSSF